VLEVQQRDHDAQRHARAPGLAGRSLALGLLAEQIQIGHGLPGVGLAHQQVGHPRLDLLPGHARRQHRQRMAQIDHLVDARAEEIVGGGAGEHHGTKLPEIKADALSEREKLYAGMKKIYSKINGLRINQGRLK